MEKAWPHPDLNDVGKAQMTPTFHVLMAAIMHYGNVGLTGLRMVNSLAGLLLILAVFWYTSKWTDAPAAFALCLPYLFSAYMLSCSMWLMTSDFALFFVALALAGAAMFPATTPRVVGNSLAAMGATGVRQIHIWLVAPMMAAIAYDRFCAYFPKLTPPELRGQPPMAVLLNNLIALSLPLAALLFFVLQWHGLMSPTAQLQGVHNHFTIIPLALAQAGFCCFFLAPAVLEKPLTNYLRDGRIWAGAAAFLVLAALPRTVQPAGPSGALAELARTPVLFGRILILLPPAALGGAGFTALLLAAAERGRLRGALIILVGFFSWLAAHTTPAYALRQYCDVIMVMVIWLAALCLPPGPRRVRFWLWTGALSAVQLAMAIYQIYLPVLWGK
jgi:hypothetical protein